MPIEKPLSGLTLIEAVGSGPLALTSAARMCGRIAADLGARVVRLVPAGAISETARDCFLDFGKEIVSVLREGLVERLAAFADADCVIVDESLAGQFEGRSRGSDVVVLAMSLDDPLGGSEFTVEARSGLLDLVGEPGKAPLRLGGHQVAYSLGLAAYLAVIDLCNNRKHGSKPSTRRVDMLDVAVWLNWKAVGSAALGLPVPTRVGTAGDWVVAPCRDGFVAVVYRSQDWDALKAALGEPRLDDGRFTTETDRRQNRVAVNAVLADVFANLSRAEIRRLSMAHRIPLGPVWTAEELKHDPHMRHRGYFHAVDCDGNILAMPLVPVKWSGARLAPAGSVRRANVSRPSIHKTLGETQSRLPLRYRVLDLGIITAGAGTSAILADLGADVIKIESPTYQDPFRKWDGEYLEGQVPDLPPYFRMTNRGKRNLGLDLKTVAGREVFLRLVKSSDVVVENFRRGVLDKLGLGYKVLKAANPDIILASISSQGEDGPDSGYVSFGSTLEAMAGLAAVTGYDGGPPVVTGKEFNYPDQVVAIFAAGMIETARLATSRGGGGVHLDLSQRELTSFLSGDAFMSGGGRRGNAVDGAALQDCYLSADARWIAATISDKDLGKLADVARGGERQAIARWIASMTSGAALAALSRLGLPAVAVATGAGALAERTIGWQRALNVDPIHGVAKGVLFERDQPAASLRRPAALVGADTRDVLVEAGCYTLDEVDRLAGVFVRAK